jgi:hypothetical protein
VNPQALVTGDFNGDGRRDFAVLNSGDSSVSVLLGNADGSFKAAQNFLTGAEPVSLATGDFNGDGKLDLATINGSFDLSVLPGKVDGSFAPAVTVPSGISVPSGLGSGFLGAANAPSVAVGDLNGDGKLDLVVTSSAIAVTYGSYGWNSYTTYMYANVLLGHGDGAFASPATYTIGSVDWFAGGTPPTSAAVGDFNRDGKPDVVTAGYFGTNVLLGDGKGILQTPAQLLFGLSATSFAVGDLNGDGKLDVALTSVPVAVPGGHTAMVSVLLGNGDGTFQTGQDFAAAASSVAIGDFNKDGKLDLAVANPSGVNVFLGNGNGTFQPDLTYATGSAPSAAAVGDFNGDGFTDLAVDNAGSNAVSVLLNAKDWSALPPQVSSFAVNGFPSPTTAGVAGSFTVTAKKSDGTTATNYTGTVHFSSSDVKAGLPAAYIFTAADQGVHTFSATLKTAGAQSITATDTTTGSITGSETGITVKAAAASKMTVAGFPSPITAGVAGTLTVTLKDPYGNISTGYTGTIHFTSSDTKASLPANYTFTAADAGVHTFSATLKTAGTESISAKDTVTGAITGTDGSITVMPGAASQFIISAPSSVTAGVAFSLTIKVKDAYGNVVTGYTGTIHFTSTDTTATLPAAYTFSAADKGVHTFTGVILRKKGHQKITVFDTLNNSITGSVIENVV